MWRLSIFISLLLFACLSTSSVFGQTPETEDPEIKQDARQPGGQTDDGETRRTKVEPPIRARSNLQQPKRILGIIPNYRSVSADDQLPPLSTRSKFVLATKDSFDYSSLIVAGMLAGTGQARNNVPEFGQGGAGYGRYLWHTFTDQVVGNYLTEAIVPSLTHQDPRYYTLGHGSAGHRIGYAVSRLVVIRTDSGGRAFNFSEIAGNGAGAGISNLYYPAPERTWSKTSQKWATQVALDGIFNIFKEFWPDISAQLSHHHSR